MASRGVNRVILIGNLGGDPEVRYSNSGAAITNCTIATSESWKDKQTGEMQDRTEWHRVVFFNRLGEIAGEYLRKGSKVYIEGQLRTRKWQDSDGNDRYTTEIVAKEMQMLDSRGDGQGQPQQPQQQNQAPQRRQQSPQGRQQGGYVQPPAYHGGQQGNTNAQPPQGGFDDFEDDIPFAPYMRMMAV